MSLSCTGAMPMPQAETQEPELLRIINALSSRLEDCGKLSNEINVRAGYIMPIIKSPCDHSNEGKPTEGAIAMLWDQVEKLARINQILDESANHLKKIVGQ